MLFVGTPMLSDTEQPLPSISLPAHLRMTMLAFSNEDHAESAHRSHCLPRSVVDRPTSRILWWSMTMTVTSGPADEEQLSDPPAGPS
jgi:hypothetical protein